MTLLIEGEATKYQYYLITENAILLLLLDDEDPSLFTAVLTISKPAP